MGHGGTQRGTSLIWGYAKDYSFDLGVRKYQKVENACSKVYDKFLYDDYSEEFRKQIQIEM